MIVGEDTSNGTLRVENGGRMEFGFVELAPDTGGTGTVTVTGSGSSLINHGALYVGGKDDGTGGSVNGGSGVVHIQSGGIMQAADVRFFSNGVFEVENGSNTVSGLEVVGGADVAPPGPGGTLGDLVVGRSTAARMVIRSGGTVANNGCNIGFNSGADGSVLVTDPGTQWNNSGDLIFGLSGTGTLTIQSGGAVSSAGFTNVRGYLGFNNGASGTATVSGAGSSWTTTGSLWVGNAGSGFLNVSNGGSVTTGGNGYLGFATSGYGSAIISGTGSAWNTAGTIYVGGSASAPGGGFGTYLQIADGASVNASAITLYNTGELFLANNTTCTGPLTSLGGAIRTFGDTALTNNITLGSGGLTVITNVANTTSVFSGNLTGSGGLTKFGFSTIGLGTLTLTGTSNYTGDTIVNAGSAFPEHLSVIRPKDNYLLLQQLHFEEELRTPTDINLPAGIKLSTTEINMAMQLINKHKAKI